MLFDELLDAIDQDLFDEIVVAVLFKRLCEIAGFEETMARDYLNYGEKKFVLEAFVAAQQDD